MQFRYVTGFFSLTWAAFVDSQYYHHIGKIFHFLEEDHLYKEICFQVKRKGVGSEVEEVTDVSDKWCMAVTESDAFCQQFLGSWYRHGERAFLGTWYRHDDEILD